MPAAWHAQISAGGAGTGLSPGLQAWRGSATFMRVHLRKMATAENPQATSPLLMLWAG